MSACAVSGSVNPRGPDLKSALTHYNVPVTAAAPPPRRASVTGPVAESSVAGVSRGVVLRMMNASVPYGYEYLGNR